MLPDTNGMIGNRGLNIKYNYSAAITFILSIITCFAAIVFLPLLPYFLSRREWMAMSIDVVFAIVPVLLFRATMCRASIKINEDGIAAFIFGFEAKTISWKNMTKIRKTRVTNGYNYVDSFSVFDGNHSLICRYFVNVCGGIMFSQDIRGLRDLLDKVSFYARRYEVPLVVLDTEAAAKEFARDQAPGRWKRGMAKSAEVRVSEF